MKNLEKKAVEYGGGSSRYNDESVDYMLVEIDGMEFYAEISIEDAEIMEQIRPLYAGSWGSPTDEDVRYDRLVDEIAYQAEQAGIDVNRLIFWYD